jgi:hypothetical protein
MVGQVDEVMLYYAEIADTYGIAPPDAGNPSSAAPSSAPSN